MFAKQKDQIFKKKFKIHYGLCAYCFNPVMRVRQAKKLKLKYDNHYVYLKNGNKIRAATLEHVIPVSIGGPKQNQLNIILSCYQCNYYKALIFLLRNKQITMYCNKCKRLFIGHFYSRKCPKCIEEKRNNKIEYFGCLMGHA